MNVSLPDDLKSYVDARVWADDYQSSSEYVRELIRQDQEVQRFRDLTRVGLSSQRVGAADDQYFEGLRQMAELARSSR